MYPCSSLQSVAAAALRLPQRGGVARRWLQQQSAQSQRSGKPLRGGGSQRTGKGGRRQREDRPAGPRREPRLASRVLGVGRVGHMTRQGRATSFRAVVVAGTGEGAAGFGIGRGATARIAVDKAYSTAKKDLQTLLLSEHHGLYHDVVGKHNNTKVLIRAVRPLSGLRASPMVRAICEVFGLHNCSAKVLGRTTPATVVYATFDALRQHKTPDETALLLGRRFQKVRI